MSHARSEGRQRQVYGVSDGRTTILANKSDTGVTFFRGATRPIVWCGFEPPCRLARLWTTIRGDSIYAELVRVPRHFQLGERQFHWLSAYNR